MHAIFIILLNPFTEYTKSILLAQHYITANATRPTNRLLLKTTISIFGVSVVGGVTEYNLWFFELVARLTRRQRLWVHHVGICIPCMLFLWKLLLHKDAAYPSFDPFESETGVFIERLFESMEWTIALSSLFLKWLTLMLILASYVWNFAIAYGREARVALGKGQTVLSYGMTIALLVAIYCR